MKLKPFVFISFILFFLDVVSVGSCLSTNSNKGKVYIHTFIETESINHEKNYEEINLRSSLEGKYKDGDIISYNQINELVMSNDYFIDGREAKATAILGFYKLDYTSNPIYEWTPIIPDEDGIMLSSDLIIGYEQGIRGAYHIAVYVEIAYE